jgi:hypothetical protein
MKISAAQSPQVLARSIDDSRTISPNPIVAKASKPVSGSLSISVNAADFVKQGWVGNEQTRKQLIFGTDMRTGRVIVKTDAGAVLGVYAQGTTKREIADTMGNPKSVLYMKGDKLSRNAVSNDAGHPVNQATKTIYLSRSGNFKLGKELLPLSERVNITADALRRAGPNGRLTIEADGSFGSYAKEVMPVLAGQPARTGKKAVPGALSTVPRAQRPEISFLLSGGRPLIGTDIANVAKSQQGGVVGETTDQNVKRVVPNWGNDQVFDAYKARVTDTVTLAKANGLKPNVTIDDHLGIPPAMMGSFKSLNGISSDEQAQKIITGRIGQLADVVHAKGGEFTLSMVGTPAAARKFGVDPFQIGAKLDVLEMQIYRENANSVKQNLTRAIAEITYRVSELPKLKEIRVALTTRANGHNLTERELIAQQSEVAAFQKGINRLYESKNLVAPKVTTSLWQYSTFYK